MKYFISLEEAIDILEKNVPNLEIEEINLIDALNRVLAVDIYSTINNPPFNKSAMDGYAIKFEDSLNNSKVKIIDKVFAGDVSTSTVISGSAVRIMTGTMIPEGANAVIKQEDVSLEEEYITLNKALKINENICFIGEDIKEGTLLVNKRKKLNYADIGILASSGIKKVSVYRKPQIALISTGNEIVDINEELVKGKIFNSNKYTILSRLIELGYDVKILNHIYDDAINIGDYIDKISKEVDLIITTGGVSVGEKDLLNEAIENINGEKLFWKIKIKPGSAVLCSKVNNSIVISLSGNPTAALTTFELLAKTTLEKLSGNEKLMINREKAFLVEGYNKKNIPRRFVRGRVCFEDGKQNVYITQVKSGNGILSSNLNSNCILEIDAGVSFIEKNSLVNIIKL